MIDLEYPQTEKIASELCAGANVLSKYLAQIKHDISQYRKQISNNKRYLQAIYKDASNYKNVLMGGVKNLLSDMVRSRLSRHYAGMVLQKLAMADYVISLLINIDKEMFMAIAALLVKDMVTSLKKQEKYYSELMSIYSDLYDVVLAISRQIQLSHTEDVLPIETAKKYLDHAIKDIEIVINNKNSAPDYYRIHGIEEWYIRSRNVLGIKSGLYPSLSARWLDQSAEIALSAKPEIIKLYDKVISAITKIKKMVGRDSEWEDINVLYQEVVFMSDIMRKLPDNLKIIEVAAVSFNEKTVLQSVEDKTSSISEDMAKYIKQAKTSPTSIQKKEIEYITEIDVELAKLKTFFNSGYFEQLNEMYNLEYYKAIEDIMNTHYYFSDTYAKAVDGLNKELLSGIIGLGGVAAINKNAIANVLRKISGILKKLSILKRQTSSLLWMIEPYESERNEVLDKILSMLSEMGVSDPAKLLYTGDIGHILNNGLSDINMIASSVKCIVSDIMSGARAVIGIEDAQSQISAETMRIDIMNKGEAQIRSDEIIQAQRKIQQLKARAGIEKWLNP